MIVRGKVDVLKNIDDRIFLYFRYADLLLRIKELESWTSDFSLPSSVWLSGFFNPQSFLTAIMQSTARKNELPLDKMSLTCEVSKKYPGESMQVPRDGAYVHGLFIEGARWVFFFKQYLPLFQISIRYSAFIFNSNFKK